MKKIASFLIISMVLFISIFVIANISSEEIPSFGEIEFEDIENLVSANIPFR